MRSPSTPRPHRRPRTLAAVALAALALALLAGCGVDGGDSADPAPTTSAAAADGTTSEPAEPTEPDAPLPPIDEGLRDQLIQTYVSLGFTEDEARCVADAVIADDGSIAADPMVGGMDIINECGISASRLMELNETMGGGSVEEAFRRSFAEGLVTSGLDRADAECVADAYLDAFGTDPGPSADPGRMGPLLEGCGLTP